MTSDQAQTPSVLRGPPMVGTEIETLIGALERNPDALSSISWMDGRPPSVRRLVVDLIEEYARHTGHADLIRESIDGLVGEGLPPEE